MLTFQQFTEVVIISGDHKLHSSDQADYFKKRVKGFFRTMKIKDNNKVNLYELVILMILFSKWSTNNDKLRFIFNILDFDRTS